VLAEDRRGTLWLANGQRGLFFLKGRDWERFETPPEVAGKRAQVTFTDTDGRVWFGFTQSTILMMDGANVRTFSAKDGLQIRSVKAITGHDSHIWIGGDDGLAVWEGDRFRAVVPADGDTFHGVSGIQEDSGGDLFLSEERGVVFISATEVAKIFKDPSARVQYHIFDVRDGLPGTVQETMPYPTSVQGTDGRIWFSTPAGVAWINPAHIPRNLLPPPVVIRSITANGTCYTSPAGLKLPPRTRDLTIDYTALSLAIPDRVRFRYKLEGSDTQWQDAGTRRQAFYTNLSPGQYLFRVTASNNDRVWNEAGASLTFLIAPAWYQTVWFRILCAAVFLGVLWALHQFRIWSLQQREKKLREVIATIPTFAWTALPDGSVDFLNRHYENYTGFPIEKVVGSFWTTVVHPEDLERHVKKFRLAMATGDLFETESRFRRTDGQYLWFSTRAVPLRDSRGKIVKWYGTSIEIEDRKRAEQLQADLAHVNRVSTMSELAASLAHEIKQPIGAAVTNAEVCLRLLNRNEPDVADACEAAFEMTKDARRAADIIDRVRALYQKDRPQLEPVDVNEVIGEMLIMLRNQANRYSVTVCADLAEGLPPVMADRVQLQQVFMNLMLNGIETMKDAGGELSIRSQLSEDGQLLIAVTDNGMGLPAGRADEIFNAFFTTKSQGTRLGLAITRSILESHGGRIWATANSERGTTLFFTLPIRTTVSA
jgi:PAS domain S-box-containing protein